MIRVLVLEAKELVTIEQTVVVWVVVIKIRGPVGQVRKRRPVAPAAVVLAQKVVWQLNQTIYQRHISCDMPKKMTWHIYKPAKLSNLLG